MVNELWSTSYRLLKPEYQTAESSGSNASVSALWCWRIDNGVWGVPYQSMGALVIAPAHLKVFFPPTPDSASPSDAGR